MRRIVGWFTFPPWLLGKVGVRLWRLEDDDGSQKGVLLEINNDAKQDQSYPKIYVRWMPRTMTLFTQERQGDRPVVIKQWKV